MVMVASPDDPGEGRDIERFTNHEFAIELVPEGDSFKVIAAGLARALGHADGRDLIRSIPDAEKGSEIVPTPGGEQRVWVLTEPGFYRAIGQRQAARVKDPAIRSQVERFQSWVYGEVLPAIRRTGRYEAVPQPPREMTKLEALRAAIESEEGRIAAEARAVEAEQQVRELEPAARSWEVLASAEGDWSLRDAALILNRDPAISTGQNRLNSKLSELGMVDRRGTPYARHHAHLTERPQTYRDRETGEERQAKPQVRITAAGLKYLHQRMGGQAPLRFQEPPLDDVG